MPNRRPKEKSLKTTPTMPVAVTGLLSKEGSLFLKGLAIIAVVWIHIQSNLKGWYYDPDTQFLAVLTDQLGRYCVPVFLAVSGYAFAFVYKPATFNPFSFLSKRLLKLLPLYFLWSAALFLTFWLIPSWWGGYFETPWWKRLLYGQADYQLYFVPLIFQFYLLFAFWTAVIKKQISWPLLIVSFLLQWLTFWYYGQIALQPNQWSTYLATDQQRYFYFISWQFYFVLGMFLSHVDLPIFNLRKVTFTLLGLIASGVGLWWAVTIGLAALAAGQNAINVMTFTRVSILWFATGAVTLLFLLGNPFLSKLRILAWPVIWLGKYSYLIFLSHTLLLRIVFGYYYQYTNLQQVMIASAILVVGWLISLRLNSE